MVDPDALRDSWPGDDQRHVQHSAIDIAYVVKASMLAKFISMVGGENNDGILPLGGVLEKLEEFSNMFVEVGKRVVIARDELSPLIGIKMVRRIRCLMEKVQLAGQAVRKSPETMIVWSRREIRLVGIEVVDEEKVGPFTSSLVPLNDVPIDSGCVPTEELVVRPTALKKRLDSR